MTYNNTYCSTTNIYGIKIYSYIEDKITLFEKKYGQSAKLGLK